MNKIVFYIDNLYRGGAQRVMHNLVCFFDIKGYEVILINDYIQDESRGLYGVPDSVKREYLQESNCGNSIIKNIKRIKNLRKLIKIYNPDVVVSFLGKTNFRMLLATIGIHTRKIVSVRNDPNREYGKNFVIKMLTNIIFTLADGCVFQTKDARSYFRKSIQNKSMIILNPVSDDFYHVERTEYPKHIVAIGRLDYQKNYNLLIDAYAVISEKYIDDDLYIYGSGPLESVLRSRVADMGLSNRVHFEGNTDNIPLVLSNKKLYVLSSDYEGLPNALMEAMASGVPSISTDCPCGGPRELIVNTDQGVLVPCRDKAHLVEAIDNVLSDDKMQRKLSLNGRERAKVFHVDNVMSQWETYLLNYN